jgi:Ca2+-binding RTX toxin-like protein
VIPFHFRTAVRRWGPAFAAVVLVAAAALPSGALAADAPGTIIINLNAVPDGPQDFRFNGAGAEFLLDDDTDSTLSNQSTIADVAPGYHTITQDPGGSYFLTDVSCIDPDNGTFPASNGVNVDVDPGETISCTFTNSLALGNVNIHLDTIPDAPPAVDFTADWGAFTLNDDGSDADGLWPDMFVDGLLPGTYLLTEPYTPGLAYVGITCDDPDGGTAIDNFGHVTLDVDAGETIDCTFTNDVAAVPPSADLHIKLDAVPDDPVDVGFTFVGGQLPFSLDDDPTDATLANSIDLLDRETGSQTFAATIPAGWRIKSLDCVDPDNGSTTDAAKAQVTVDLDDGEDITCTFKIEPIPAGPPPAPTCNGKVATIVGTAGATTIRGTAGADVIVDLDGANRIDGRGGNDTICTGPGDDVIAGGAGDDWIDAGGGTNSIDAGAGNDLVRSGAGNDTIVGDTGGDDIDAGDGANLVSAGAGNDRIVTGSGDDRIDGGKGYDLCSPGAGTNTVGNCEG